MDDTTRAEARLIAKEECEATIMKHLALCPLATLTIEQRLRKVEIKYAALIAFMLGSGIISGATVGAILRATSP